jgi:two-component system NtrC family sensor kinase
LLESERLAAIGATAAKIAHEIANPLNNIYMTTQLLERQLAKEEIPAHGQLASDLKTITSETARLNALLQQFGMISRKEKYDFHPIDVAALIKEVAETAAGFGGIRRSTLKTCWIRIFHLSLPTVTN